MNLHLFVLTLLLRLGQSLIGLRPPSADPTFRKHQLQRSTHHNIAQQAVRHYTEKELNHTQKSIANFLMQRFHKKFYLKKDVYNKLKKLDVTDTNNGKSSFNHTNEFTDERRCNHYSTLKCSIRFLKSVIRDKDVNCQSLKGISSCLCPYCVSDECSVRKSLHTIAHDRECYLDKQIQLTVTKGTVYCCEDELLKCTIDTYISMTESEPSCDSISEFTACTAGLTSTLSNLKFDRVFHLLLSLSKTCISSLKLYL